MKTVQDIFSCWDTVPDMADDVGVSCWRAKKWKARKRIPHSAWPSVMDAVKRKGKDLTADDLLAMHAAKGTRRRSPNVAHARS